MPALAPLHTSDDWSFIIVELTTKFWIPISDYFHYNIGIIPQSGVPQIERAEEHKCLGACHYSHHHVMYQTDSLKLGSKIFVVSSTILKLQLCEVWLGPELFVVFVHVCDNSISVLSANKSKHLSTPKEYWFSRDNPRKGNILFISIIRCVLYWICLWICYYSQGYFCRLDVLANVNMFCRNIICEVSFTKNLIIYA